MDMINKNKENDCMSMLVVRRDGFLDINDDTVVGMAI